MSTPTHLAIICDGNRRWAKAQGLPSYEGHRKAIEEIFQPLIEHAIKRGIKFLTFWIFSTENWQREKKEVDFLMNLFRKFFDQQIDKFNEKDIRFNMIGELSRFAPDIRERIKKGKEKTKDNQAITVTLAMNYGGRDEIVRAVNKIIQNEELRIKNNKIDTQVFAQYLDTFDMPDPELVVRTSGEQRTSGFLLWQSEYSEWYFPKWHFPEFTPEKLDECLAEFENRKRRFGK